MWNKHFSLEVQKEQIVYKDISWFQTTRIQEAKNKRQKTRSKKHIVDEP